MAILYSAVATAVSRFPQYIAEMEHFFADHGAPTRSVDALSRVTTALASDQILREDLQSMLQVIRMAEPEMGTLEVLAILLAAVTGARDAAELQEDGASEASARELFHFVKDVVRSMPADEAALQGEPALAGSLEPETAVEPAAPVPAATAVVQVPGPGAGWGRALALAAEEESFSVEDVRARPRVQSAEEAWATRVRSAETPTAPAVLLAQRKPWIYAACGIVLGLLVGIFVMRQQPVLSPAAAPAPVSAMAATARGPASPRRDGHSDKRPRGSHTTPMEARQPAAPEPGGHVVFSGATPPAVGALSRGGAEPGRALPGRAPGAVRPGLVKGLPLGPASDQAGTLPRSAGVRPGRVVAGTAGIMAANVLSSPAPSYPAQASAAQVQGEVVVEAIVGRDGDVIDTRVISGPLLLREAALQAVQRWHYRPYEVDGKPAEIATTARLEFRLGEE